MLFLFFLIFSLTINATLMMELQRRRLVVDAALRAVPDFDMTTVAINTGETDYSQNNGQVMSKSDLLHTLNGSRWQLDQKNITCEQIIKYDKH